MASTTVLLGTAKTLSFILKDIYDNAKDETKKKLSRLQLERDINQLYRKIYDIRNVKTIWKIDKKINLMSFYYPSKLIVGKETILVNGISKVKCDGNILIEGTVGQGKSIFMRYLCSQELAGGNKLPVFFQLRKIQPGQTLKENLFAVLDSWNFSMDDDLFDYLAKSGRLILFLDGFDEVSSSCVVNIVNEMEQLSEKYPDMKIVVTSRPNSGLENSPFFEVFRLAPLGKDDHRKFLLKLLQDQIQIERIEKAIAESGTKIGELLTTPLMMTLMVMVYQYEQKIPKQLSEFYENLFPLLFDRHDKTKPGFVRNRVCELNQSEILKVFEAFCYITYKEDVLEFSYTKMLDFSEKAIARNNFRCDPSALIKDISRISCLIIEDGFSYNFIHKSVQEYHAASFVKNRPDDFARNFYSKMVHLVFPRKWDNVLQFLSQIDTYRYTKYFKIPEIDFSLSYLGVSESDIESVTKKEVIELIGRVSVGFIKGTLTSFAYGKVFSTRVLDRICFESVLMASKHVIQMVPANADKLDLNLLELIDRSQRWDEVVKGFKNILYKVKQTKEDALLLLLSEEDMTSLLP